MSEYYLADRKAAERERQRRQDQEIEKRELQGAQDMKITLLGDFLFPTSEPQGCDPYNNTQGKTPPDSWQTRNWRR